MNKDSHIVIVGDNSVEGKALLGHLQQAGFSEAIGTYAWGLNLLNQSSVKEFFNKVNPEYVFLMHIKSGGILANKSYPADFIYSNLQAQSNIIHSAYKNKVKKLFYLASSCCYPAECAQPMKEDYLLSGKVERTNEAYAIAKLAGIKMVQAYAKQYGVDYITAIPATIYGPGDNFNPESGHVITALIKKFYDAKVNGADEVIVWGTGLPRREFIYVDDFINACCVLMEKYSSSEIINVGVGYDVSIKELATIIAQVVDFKGKIVFDHTKPDGVMQKFLDSEQMKKLNWVPHVALSQGIELTYNFYKSLSNINENK
ncbi:MAG: GDP-L-fucose synthase [Candidatus Omnitrophica bacterium]|nr:GDP-L-fucose synthase [Candidatus Omnitrophota bacterium]